MMKPTTSDELYQDRILPHVSRSFALTIPQLPLELRTPVCNAYLLCRIADTIEDESALSVEDTLMSLQRLVSVVRGGDDARLLGRDLLPRLSRRTSPAERELVSNMERVIRVTARLQEFQRRAIERCVEAMCGGMHQFQRTASLHGLPRMKDLDQYCYYVAGVVGELLTELFCGYAETVAQRRSGLQALAVSFAQGLQMTNILKDIWEDRFQGACWLPQELFARYGIDLAQLSARELDAQFPAALSELVGVAHTHLRNALSFTLLIPAEEAGIRRFCLWAIGLALLTLRNIERSPGFTSGRQVKVSHTGVAMTRILTSISVRHDGMLRQLFDWAARGLPLASAATVPRASPPPQHNHGDALAPQARRVIRDA
jgi:farnesyl-diphosphate farnesyltransferase